MNLKTQVGSGSMFVIVLVFLPSLILKAQDCKSTTFLDSQNIKSGDQLNVAGGTIISQPGNQVTVDVAGALLFEAVNRIELNPGFKALAGSTLHAILVPCSPDSPPADPVVVYPNPTDGIFTVKASYKIDALRLTDSNGELQLEKTDINDTSITLDISRLKSGYFILEVITGKSVMEAVRIEKK